MQLTLVSVLCIDPHQLSMNHVFSPKCTIPHSKKSNVWNHDDTMYDMISNCYFPLPPYKALTFIRVTWGLGQLTVLHLSASSSSSFSSWCKLSSFSSNFCSIPPLSSSSLSLSPPSFSLSWSSSISSRYYILIQWIIQKGQFSKVLICLKFSPFPSIVSISILNCFWSIRRV